jgi:hypothetical protein
MEAMDAHPPPLLELHAINLTLLAVEVVGQTAEVPAGCNATFRTDCIWEVLEAGVAPTIEVAQGGVGVEARAIHTTWVLVAGAGPMSTSRQWISSAASLLVTAAPTEQVAMAG